MEHADIAALYVTTLGSTLPSTFICRRVLRAACHSPQLPHADMKVLYVEGVGGTPFNFICLNISLARLHCPALPQALIALLYATASGAHLQRVMEIRHE